MIRCFNSSKLGCLPIDPNEEVFYIVEDRSYCILCYEEFVYESSDDDEDEVEDEVDEYESENEVEDESEDDDRVR